MTSTAPRLIDEWLPVFDVATRHEIDVHASPERTFEAIRRTDLGSSAVVRMLFLLRRLPAVLTGSRRSRASAPALTLDKFLEGGFVQLGERRPSEIALGLVGRYWTPSGGLVRLDAAGFRAFDRPGYARAVWTFQLLPRDDGVTRVVTETRVQCLDRGSRIRFRLYWLIVRPFSGIVRRQALRAIRREAELRRTGSSAHAG
jgi:hypothetical protein